MEDRARAELIEEYFSSTGVGAPEVEGFLWLKAEGKKTWKKFYFVLRTSGLYYAPKGKKTSKDLVCLARFDVNQVYFGVKWQPKFKAPSKHCFAIKHPQIQAKNPKYIRYLCADNELELNKWVVGIRLAKYGRALYENYRGIIEDIAHEDIDRLASARLSVNSQASADPVAKASNRQSTSESATTPGSEGKSFDSALQLTDRPQQKLQQVQQSHQNKPISPITTTVIVHSSHNGGVTCRSSRCSSTGSLGERSSSCGSVNNTHEGGFSCDSPEGGTIKKKPATKSSLVTFKPESGSSNSNGTKGSKEVRFKDTFSLIPLEKSNTNNNTELAVSSGHRPSPAQYGSLKRNMMGGGSGNSGSILSAKDKYLHHHPLDLSHHENLVYQNIEDILNNHKLALNQSGGSRAAAAGNNGPSPSPPPPPPVLDFPESPLKRRFSQESLVSNPAMLHCGTVVNTSKEAPESTAASSSRVQLSPQPQRPAPVLKPQVSRKPSLDKNLLLRKQQAVAEQQQKQQPTYEDTLKKCQSLTRTNSNPGGSSAGSNGDPNNLFNGKPPSPAVPPKPSLASRALAGTKLDSTKKISHLPPSGLHHSPRVTCSGPPAAGVGVRSSSLNRSPHQQQQLQQQLSNGAGSSFLNDLENAMSQKSRKKPGSSFDSSTPTDDSSRPFPTNRLSSGEYDNVSSSNTGSQQQQPPLIVTSSTLKKVPPLPKRNDDTHLSWNRS